MSSEPSPRRTLLLFCDSLSYYGPTGGLPSDDPRIWPNIVADQLGWDLELIGRIGWTSRDVVPFLMMVYPYAAHVTLNGAP